jgi:hypothetical protein
VDALPITRNHVSEPYTVNGVDASVFDGHLLAFRNLNLTGRANDVFSSVPGVHGLAVWRRLIGELSTLTDPTQMAL